MPRPKHPRNIPRARQLRATMSLPEVLLWQALRQHSATKFRRQHPIGAYILDFYCPQAKLAVEIDGAAHDMGDRPARDQQRDAWLASQGITVQHIPARDVLQSPATVADAILALCGAE